MSRMRGTVRVLMSLWAIMQIALPTVAVVADAGASAAGVAAHAHVEDRSHRACAPVHGADCALCQFLTGCSAPLAHGAVEIELARTASVAIDDRALSRTIALRGLHAPRGPPAV
jgi:hypothetical protein